MRSVIFVHDLRGDKLDTWSKGKICWPRDLLKKDLESARIITWGYDSKVLEFTKPASQESIFCHAEDLLADLSRLRKHTPVRNTSFDKITRANSNRTDAQ